MKLHILATGLALLLMGGCSPGHGGTSEEASLTPGQQPAGAGDRATAGAAESAETASDESRKPVLLFFLNPYGRPCQMQRDILATASGLGERSTLKLVQTTVDGDRELFYRYGVRALPLLLLTDAKGAVLHRFSPGIHRGDEILHALEQIEPL